LVGASNLDHGIAWLAERTGVRAGGGGSHPHWGTRNALLSLGADKYLEIIAPDLAQTSYAFHLEVRTLRAPRLITWAAVTTDIDAVGRRARAAGCEVFGPRDGSRVRPDGKQLEWRTLRIVSRLAIGAIDLIPFFIQWSANTVHPSIDSPKGCTLKGFRMTHPNAAAVTALLNVLAIDADVTTDADAGIHATLDTPNGIVHLR
jgi:hypothetical protein